MSFATIVDESGRKLDDQLWTARRAALMQAFERARPDIVLIELYPFGRRAFRSELKPLLDSCAATRRNFERPGIGVSRPTMNGSAANSGGLPDTVKLLECRFIPLTRPMQ